MAVCGKDETAPVSASKDRRCLLDLPPEIWSKIGKHAVDNEPNFTLETVMVPRAQNQYH
ncbi:hypothetical protein CLAFUW4_13211 [Fulvia fulva]|nr:hypothetical protein CLAFUR4_13216 [Fulvia fulva]KAK4612631.1 hypothetical protein CLAFUR0_13220 [Fulvia fulva]WPV21069.1 hypothetical protein CLAFUW4_13211 [Fulvia fulva]